MVPHPWQVGNVVFMCLQNLSITTLSSREHSVLPVSLQQECHRHTEMTVSFPLHAEFAKWGEGGGEMDTELILSPALFPQKKKERKQIDHFKLQPLDLFQRKSTPLQWPKTILFHPCGSVQISKITSLRIVLPHPAILSAAICGLRISSHSEPYSVLRGLRDLLWVWSHKLRVPGSLTCKGIPESSVPSLRAHFQWSSWKASWFPREEL